MTDSSFHVLFKSFYSYIVRSHWFNLPVREVMSPIGKYNNKPFQHLSFWDRFDLNTLVTSTRIGRSDMLCARVSRVGTGYWRNSEGSV